MKRERESAGNQSKDVALIAETYKKTTINTVECDAMDKSHVFLFDTVSSGWYILVAALKLAHARQIKTKIIKLWKL